MLFAYSLRLLGLALTGSACGLAACQSPGHAPTAAPAPAAAARATPTPPVLPLVPQRLGQRNFWLSLPANYALKATDGPDFLVYYFAPVDTTVYASCTGGLYLGGHPQGFTKTANCQQRRVARLVLGRPAFFTVQRCATGYTLDAVFDSGSGQAWDSKPHAFGTARSTAELRQLLAIFATPERRARLTAGY